MEDDVNVELPVPAQDLPALEALLASVPWPQGTAPDGLDDEMLAAWAEGNLSTPEAEAIESRLAESDEGRAWMAQVRASHDVATEQAPAAARAPAFASWMPLAAVALLLVAFGVALALGGFDATPSEPTTMAAAAETFRDGGYPDFRLLTDAELAGTGREVERGGLVALTPRHSVEPKDARALAWKSSAGTDTYAVRLFDSEGREIWKLDSIPSSQTNVQLPSDLELPAGSSYVWEVRGDDGFGAQTARASFRIPSAEDIVAVTVAFLKTRNSPQSIQRMLMAQVSICREMFSAAAALLAEELNEPTPHPDAQKLYDFVKRQ